MLAGGISLENLCQEDADDYMILDSLPGQQSQRKPALDRSEYLLGKLLQSIEIIGFNMTLVPAITNLTYFMNKQLWLLERKREAEAHACEFMTGQLLVTTKRSTQAAELFRKMQIKEL